MQTIFERSEKKYMLTPLQCQQFYESIKAYIECDSYDDYTIYNLYFDTSSYELIRRSIDKPLYKEKLRLRCYELPMDDSSVFVELKKKYDGTVFKRRIECTLKEAEELLYHHVPLANQQQIVKEIQYFLTFYQPVPKLFLSYDRRAFHGVEDASLRITFDSNVQYRTQALDLREKGCNTPYFKHGEVLMEIKCASAMPLWMSHALSALQLYPASFSKYGKIYADCLYPTQRKEISYV